MTSHEASGSNYALLGPECAILASADLLANNENVSTAAIRACALLCKKRRKGDPAQEQPFTYRDVVECTGAGPTAVKRNVTELARAGHLVASEPLHTGGRPANTFVPSESWQEMTADDAPSTNNACQWNDKHGPEAN